MPIYEYQCGECGHRLEALQKISDAPLTRCPACEKDGLTKLISAASFRLKGGGWYETDFKTGDKKHLADSGDKSPSASGSGAPAKSDKGDSGKSADAGGTDKGKSDAKDSKAKTPSKAAGKTTAE